MARKTINEIIFSMLSDALQYVRSLSNAITYRQLRGVTPAPSPRAMQHPQAPSCALVLRLRQC